MARTFDHSQIKDYLNTVDDHTAEFINSEFAGARLVGFISQQHAQGYVPDVDAAQLLDDAYRLMRLSKLGHKYVKLARNPSPEIRIMVLADEARERRTQ